MPTDTVSRTNFRSSVATGWRAVSENWKPFALIQACAFLAVAAYYNLPGFAAAANTAGQVKAAGGYVLSAAATVFASLVLPEAARRITRTAVRVELREVLFRVGFFANIGIIVDALYRLMALVFGSATTLDVVLKKALFDQFVFSPTLSIPLSAIAFLWRDAGFQVEATRDLIRNGHLARHYGAMLVSCWGFWFPTLGAVYAMPSELQFVLYLFAQAAWSLLLIHMAADRR